MDAETIARAAEDHWGLCWPRPGSEAAAADALTGLEL